MKTFSTQALAKELEESLDGVKAITVNIETAHHTYEDAQIQLEQLETGPTDSNNLIFEVGKGREYRKPLNYELIELLSTSLNAIVVFKLPTLSAISYISKYELNGAELTLIAKH